MEHRKRRGSFALLILILLLVLVFLYSGLQVLESTVFDRNNVSVPEETSGKTIERNGVKYFPRQDITVLLLAGIDEDGVVQSSGSYNNTGEADMISLLIFDHTNENIDVIALNRDTMLTMPVLGIGGKKAGTRYAQLALAHTYGDGLTDSALNLRTTVSDFLYGLQIDYYVNLNMDAIAILNDAVGGVTVNVTEDFSAVDPAITKGTVTLRGQQATTFVRTRQGVGSQLNTSRMERQQAYMHGFMKALGSSLNEDQKFTLETYRQVEPYMVTDCSSTVISSILERYGDYPLDEIITPEGENVRGEKYMEFHVDEEKLDELILRYLYAPKN